MRLMLGKAVKTRCYTQLPERVERRFLYYGILFLKNKISSNGNVGEPLLIYKSVKAICFQNTFSVLDDYRLRYLVIIRTLKIFRQPEHTPFVENAEILFNLSTAAYFGDEFIFKDIGDRLRTFLPVFALKDSDATELLS